MSFNLWQRDKDDENLSSMCTKWRTYDLQYLKHRLATGGDGEVQPQAMSQLFLEPPADLNPEQQVKWYSQHVFNQLCEEPGQLMAEVLPPELLQKIWAKPTYHSFYDTASHAGNMLMWANIGLKNVIADPARPVVDVAIATAAQLAIDELSKKLQELRNELVVWKYRKP